ncbi:MAG: flavin reductase family protein [Faecalibacillus sp.]
MRKNFGAKAYLYPQPVLIIATYDENHQADAMNAAWGGISDSNEIMLSLSSSHKTVKNILAGSDLTISIATADYVKECDYVGIVSGNDVDDKLAQTAFHIIPSSKVNAPIIEELPLTLECQMKSYQDEIMFVEIINVSIDESILTDDHIDIDKLKAISFDPMNHQYIQLGKVVGKAFQDGRLLK